MLLPGWGGCWTASCTFLSPPHAQSPLGSEHRVGCWGSGSCWTWCHWWVAKVGGQSAKPRGFWVYELGQPGATGGWPEPGPWPWCLPPAASLPHRLAPPLRPTTLAAGQGGCACPLPSAVCLPQAACPCIPQAACPYLPQAAPPASLRLHPLPPSGCTPCLPSIPPPPQPTLATRPASPCLPGSVPAGAGGRARLPCLQLHHLPPAPDPPAAPAGPRQVGLLGGTELVAWCGSAWGIIAASAPPPSRTQPPCAPAGAGPPAEGCFFGGGRPSHPL